MVAGYVFVVVTAAIISWAATHWVRREAPRWGLVDHPGGRKRHRAPTATAGGLAIWLALVGSLAVAQTPLWPLADGTPAEGPGWDAAAGLRLTGSVEYRTVGVLLTAATALTVLGLIDDLRGLGWRLRLGVQAVVAGSVTWQWVALLPYSPAATAPWLIGALSAVWLVVLVNAFNMLDNMDGLAAGVAGIIAVLLAAIALLAPGDGGAAGSAILAFLFALIGSLLGFLWHNRPPARVFMGDSGSYLVGFSVGAAALLIARDGAGVGDGHPVWIPVAALLCVFAVPLYDVASVMLIRLSQGRSPFLPDRQHLSHRLAESGLGERRAVLVIYLLTAVWGLPALLLLRLDPAVAPAVLLGMGGLLAALAVIDAFLWRRTRAAEACARRGSDSLTPSADRRPYSRLSWPRSGAGGWNRSVRRAKPRPPAAKP